MERRIASPDPATTTALGRALAAAARPGDLICLWGELGAGKTHLAKAFGAGLGVTATINSPSFILMAEYAGRLPLFHIDLYRLETPRELASLGLEDLWDRGDAIVLVEWGERFRDQLPPPDVEIHIESDGGARSLRFLTQI